MAGVTKPRPEVLAAPRKRKVLEDFFVVSNRSSKYVKGSLGTSAILCHPSQSDTVPGLEIRSDFISESEEEALLEFLEQQEWRTDLARRVIHYGGTYCLMPPRTATPEERQKIQDTILTAPPMPHQFDLITTRMADQQLYTKATLPEFCIVNEYKESQGISAHVENFRFKSPVCGLSLCQGDWMRFHELVKPDDGSVRSGKAAQAERTGKRVDVWMPRRSLLVMKDEAREKWQHEIVRSKKGRDAPGWKRVSLTFRTEKEERMNLAT